MTRFVFMVLDGVGVGALPDAADYGDAGSTRSATSAASSTSGCRSCRELGPGQHHPDPGVPPVPEPLALPGRLAPLSAGKDTTVGHWEHMGLVTARPFPTYPHGFPEEVVAPVQGADRPGRAGQQARLGHRDHRRTG